MAFLCVWEVSLGVVLGLAICMMPPAHKIQIVLIYTSQEYLRYILRIQSAISMLSIAKPPQYVLGYSVDSE